MPIFVTDFSKTRFCSSLLGVFEILFDFYIFQKTRFCSSLLGVFEILILETKSVRGTQGNFFAKVPKSRFFRPQLLKRRPKKLKFRPPIFAFFDIFCPKLSQIHIFVTIAPETPPKKLKISIISPFYLGKHIESYIIKYKSLYSNQG